MLKYIFFIPALLLVVSCSRENTTEPVDNGLPPNQPTGLNLYLAHDGEIGFEWEENGTDLIDHYNIYKGINDSINLIKIGETADYYYEEYYLEYDTTYFFAVTAVNIFNRESIFSRIISAKPVNRYHPYPPYQISVNAQNWYDTLSVQLYWYSSYDTDVKGYSIYRDTTDLLDLSALTPVGFTNGNSFRDTTNLKILTKYFYKIVAVDKGNLQSSSTFFVSDIIYDRPQLIFPGDNSILKMFAEFEFNSISMPARYKLIIQRNKLFDEIYQKEFSISEINSNIKVGLTSVSLEPYKKYYWRVITYSNNKSEPNSFSDLFSFTLIP